MRNERHHDLPLEGKRPPPSSLPRNSSDLGHHGVEPSHDSNVDSHMSNIENADMAEIAQRVSSCTSLPSIGRKRQLLEPFPASFNTKIGTAPPFIDFLSCHTCRHDRSDGIGRRTEGSSRSINPSKERRMYGSFEDVRAFAS